MRYGVVTAFLASSSVHRDLLRMLLRVPMQSDIPQYGSPTGSRLGQPVIRKLRFGLTAI
jgi:hypothetical protein